MHRYALTLNYNAMFYSFHYLIFHQFNLNNNELKLILFIEQCFDPDKLLIGSHK